ncbi:MULTISPECIES: HAD-IA family hydrolase [Rhizobium]|uniref:HAD family hydrolase n=1 Tax=Rhizobium tropici TaxID=398 RepID=A0A329Y3D8_RHITR|nr:MULTISPECIES: HAD-IA family hydrolase [Rhizobium]MBB3285709.1 sugar-phosphatase [Rhizobium sp. BK252]MBB3400449.1 sugar-phosphatase [Rhizobium sp. BK289]MBB3413028.1 sugar-phosphatase [Rhizobium sp. BK284]MBB3480915.1 sugar-phosphatase [Rhizobium sp. BK347]MDK4721589.1 HAD-IA family hydrolase [Rhizobium sp. CNPSo 3968]
MSFDGRSFGAFLFDMDGTVLNSIAVAERVWTAWAEKRGIDAVSLLATVHGRKAIETITRLNLSGIDPAEEVRVLTQAEIDDVAGVEPIAGAIAFLKNLPSDRWAIVTSAPRELARVRLEAAGIPRPPVLIAGEDVHNGKPAPDCFILAARILGQPIEDCLVFEDAPAGIEAAEASGASVLVISATHRAPLLTRHPSIESYDRLALDIGSGGALHLTGKLT